MSSVHTFVRFIHILHFNTLSEIAVKYFSRTKRCIVVKSKIYKCLTVEIKVPCVYLYNYLEDAADLCVVRSSTWTYTSATVSARVTTPPIQHAWYTNAIQTN